MTNVGGRHQYLGGTIQEYGSDIIIISGTYGGHTDNTRSTTDNGQ